MMKRIFISMLALLLCVVTFAACDFAEEKQTEEPTAAPIPTDAPTETEESTENCIVLCDEETNEVIKTLSASDSDKILSILDSKNWFETRFTSEENYTLYCPDGRILHCDIDIKNRRRVYVNDYENNCCVNFDATLDGSGIQHEGDTEKVEILTSIILGEQ